MSSNQTKKKTHTSADTGSGPQNLEAMHKNKPKTILPHDPQRSTLSFPLFNNLPSELRLKIWIYVAHSPSIIIKNSTKGTGLTFNSRTDHAVPPMFQVCRETRYEFLHQEGVVKNHLTYRQCKMGIPSTFGPMKYVYVSFNIDMLLPAKTKLISKSMFASNPTNI